MEKIGFENTVTANILTMPMSFIDLTHKSML